MTEKRDFFAGGSSAGAAQDDGEVNSLREKLKTTINAINASE